MELPVEVEAELSRAREAEKDGNNGRARVCARRAVGKAFAMSNYPKHQAPALSTTQILNILSADETLAEEIRAAAERLAASVAVDHGESVSVYPLQDALTIISGILES